MDFYPVEEEARARASYRAGEEGRAPGQAGHERTAQAVVLEGGATADEVVRLLSEVLTELRALRVGMALVTGQEI